MPREAKAFSFIHCADLHLDSPFLGLSLTDGAIAERLRKAPLEALRNIIDLAIRERVDFILFAGDVFDSRVRSPRSRMAFRDALNRAARAGIRSYVAHGNHDHLGTDMGVPLWNEEMGDMVHIFGAQPETIDVLRNDELIARITGVSHDRDKLNENLAASMRGVPGSFNIGLLHCNIGTVSDVLPYAPCSLGDLMDKGIDYWALGHIHKRQVLHENPHVVYSGNTQGRHANETGAKGVYLVQVRHGRLESLDFHAVDTVRWERKELDVSDLETDEDVVEATRLERYPLLTLQRLTLVGRTPLDATLRIPGRLEELRELMNEGQLWVESIELKTRPPIDLEARRGGEDLLAETLQQGDRLRSEGPKTILEKILERAANIQGNRMRPYLDLLDDEEFLDLIEEAEIWCADMMLEAD